MPPSEAGWDHDAEGSERGRNKDDLGVGAGAPFEGGGLPKNRLHYEVNADNDQSVSQCFDGRHPINAFL
jgi:hypothetical protein